jgi:hypothetical protein
MFLLSVVRRRGQRTPEILPARVAQTPRNFKDPILVIATMMGGGTLSLAPEGQACPHSTPVATISDSSYTPLLTSPPPLAMVASPPSLPAFQIPHPTNLCLWPGCRCLQKEYLSFYDLDFHIKTYHARQCPWPTCNTQRSFRRRSDLLRHMESVHSGARRFICDSPGCSKSYSWSDKLTAHRRTHSTTTSRPPVPDINARAFGIRNSIRMDIRGFSLIQTEPTQGQNSGPRTGPVEPSTELSSVQFMDSLGDSPQGPTYSFDQIRSSRTHPNHSQMSYHTIPVRSDGSGRSNNPALCSPTQVPEDPRGDGEDFSGPTSCSRRIIWTIWLAFQPLQAIQWPRDVQTHCQVRFHRRWVPCRCI